MQGYGGYGRGIRRGFGAGFGGFVSMPNPLPPPPSGVFRIATAVLDNRGLDSIISPRFARAPFLAIIDIMGGAITNIQVIGNPAASAPRGAGVAVAQWLISSGVRAVLAVNLGHNVYTILRQASVAIYTVQPGIRIIDALRSVGLVKG
ncbi:MAG: hypothetical protein DRO15_01080 [Thermoprotei archaeon]|nr:MAG: hypothetical protein DRO15_01080 [Thermoprotei archaeon]